jgi:hypothetical protein
MCVEHHEVTRAREIWSETGNPHLAIAAFPSRFYAERKLLEGLAKHGRTNYVNSLSMVSGLAVRNHVCITKFEPSLPDTASSSIDVCAQLSKLYLEQDG